MPKKNEPKIRKVTLQQITDCYQNHDFYQISEPANYLTSGGLLGGLPAAGAIKPPRFICRKCGKVIQL